MPKPAFREVLKKWLPGSEGQNRLGGGLEVSNGDPGFDFGHESSDDSQSHREAASESTGVYHTELMRYALEDSTNWVDDLFEPDTTRTPVEGDFYRSPSPRDDEDESAESPEPSAQTSVSFESSPPETTAGEDESDPSVSVTFNPKRSTPEPSDITELGTAVDSSRKRAEYVAEQINDALSVSSVEAAEARISTSTDTFSTPLENLDLAASDEEIALGSSIEAIRDGERRLEEGVKRATVER